MSNNLSWRDALKEFNDKRTKDGGKYTIPKRGTPEYGQVRELMGEKITDAVPLKEDKALVAGLSSFGFGGTNAHIIIGESPTEGSADGATSIQYTQLPEPTFQIQN